MRVLGDKFQFIILKLMLRDYVFCEKCSLYLTRDYFSNKYNSWYYEKIVKYFDKYKTSPSEDYLIDQIALVSENEQVAFAQILANIVTAEEKDVRFIKDELKIFMQTAEFKKLYVNASDHFNAGRYQDAFDLTNEVMEKIKKMDFLEDDYIKEAELNDIIFNVDQQLSEEIPVFAVDSFQFENKEVWSGKIPKGSLTAVIGGYGTGKTMTMINMMVNAVNCKHKSVYVFLEGRKEQIVRRIISRLTGIPNNALRYGKFTQDQMKLIETAKKTIKDYIVIKEMRKIGLTVEEYVDWCRNLYFEFKYDLLVCDYGQKLKLKKKSGEHRLDQAYIADMLDQFAGELKIALLTGAQVNREGVKKGRNKDSILRSDHISEAIGIAHTCETIITLNRSSQDEIDNRMIFCLDKCRDYTKGLLIESRTDFNKCITHNCNSLTVLGYDTQNCD